MFQSYKLHHVGVICPDMEAAQHQMNDLGLLEEYRGYVEQWQCWCIFTAPANGGAAIELVVATGGPLLKFNKGGGGVHHFAFEVPDIQAAMRWSQSQGMRMIEPEPIKGAGDFLCNFLSPVSTRGVQIELVQPFAANSAFTAKPSRR